MTSSSHVSHNSPDKLISWNVMLRLRRTIVTWKTEGKIFPLNFYFENGLGHSPYFILCKSITFCGYLWIFLRTIQSWWSFRFHRFFTSERPFLITLCINQFNFRRVSQLQAATIVVIGRVVHTPVTIVERIAIYTTPVSDLRWKRIIIKRSGERGKH